MNCTNLSINFFFFNINNSDLLIVFPVKANCFRYLRITNEVKESIPVVGSSIIITEGFDITS